ncbi:RNA exonuclease 5 [Merluccius polli]|uniref:RNA exonuclease 5 n=1 Tax=Merluccius polli TaxID=89951 RepID=A0AA47N0S8_MERPO|nr:RNA exonuclease 5 [Merluccius polli]
MSSFLPVHDSSPKKKKKKMSPPTRKRKETPGETTAKTTKKRRLTQTEDAGRRPPRVSVPPARLQQQLTLELLTEMLHYAALGTSNGAQQPSWCHLHRQKDIKAVNVVVLDGLTQCHFYKHFLAMQHLRTDYTTVRDTHSLSHRSATDLPSGIFSSEVPESVSSCFAQRDQESNRLRDGRFPYALRAYSAERPTRCFLYSDLLLNMYVNDFFSAVLRLHPVIRKFGTQVKGLTAYTLTKEERIKRHFPVRGVHGFEDFVSTESADVTDSSPLYGLDCEMCLTAKGNELARVSLVDSSGKCVLDELVQPPNPILNYLTRFSGITAAMLQSITTLVSDVQRKLLSLLPRDAVLVGHSLDNDLRALKLIHPHVIDTSLLYTKEFGQKFKLKVLAEAVLGKQIQTEEQRGHDPMEDASAALQLAHYFINAGPRQVVERHIKELWGESLTISKPTDVRPTPATKFADVLKRSGQSVTFIGKRADISINPSNQQWHSSDKEVKVLASFRRQTAQLSFSVVQFSSFSDHMKNSCLQQEHHHQRLRAHLRHMCVVFAGPFPPGFGERDVKRLFRCCGAVRRIRMLPTTHRIHAEIEFKLLEGAVLAVKTLSGHSVHGQHIQVQRPVHESTLDLDLTLDALVQGPLNVNRVHVMRLKPNVNVNIVLNTNGHTPGAHWTTNNVNPDENGTTTTDAYTSKKAASFNETLMNAHDQLLQAPSACAPSEKELTEVFGRFGVVERVLLPVKPNGRRARHATISKRRHIFTFHPLCIICKDTYCVCLTGMLLYVTEFQSPEGVGAVLGSSEELRDQRYLVCPSLTPDHLCSWAPGTKAEEVAVDEKFSSSISLMENNTMDGKMERVMKKLDQRLRKLFKSLPDHTMSVVVLPGHTSPDGHFPGLCFMEVKNGFL